MAYIAEIGTIKEWEISTSYISKAHGNFVNQINWKFCDISYKSYPVNFPHKFKSSRDGI